MQEQWDMTVTYLGRPCGTMHVYRQGLYYEFQCDCDPVTDAVLRAYLVLEDCQECLGVMIPEHGRLALRRKIPASRLSKAKIDSARLEGCTAGWMPWEGKVYDYPVADAMSKQENGQQLVAFPFSSEEPFPYMALCVLCTPVSINGQLYLSMPLPAKEDELD